VLLVLSCLHLVKRDCSKRTIRTENAGLAEGLRLVFLECVHVNNFTSDNQNQLIVLIKRNLLWIQGYWEFGNNGWVTWSKHIARTERQCLTTNSHSYTQNSQRNSRRITDVRSDAKARRVFLVRASAVASPAIYLHPLLLNGFLQNDTPLRGLTLFINGPQRPQSSPYAADSNKDQEHRWEVCGTKKSAEVSIRFAGGCYCLIFGCLLIYGDAPGVSLRSHLRRIAGSTLVGLGLAAFLFPAYYQGDRDNKGNPPPFLSPSHSENIVPQKYMLTSTTYWGTVIGIGRANMAPFLERTKQVAIISALAEGSGIRQIERMTGVHRDTIMRLGVRVGKGCASLLDSKMRDLSCDHLQFDELWGFIGKKQKHATPAMAAGIERDFWTVGNLVEVAA
jgi:hypothetical protein